MRPPAVDMRCPTHPIRLFGRLLLDADGEPYAYEVACRDCRRDAPTGVQQVFHVYTLDGMYRGTRHV